MTAASAPALDMVPAGRADARRNRELVLRTAMRAFADDGPTCPSAGSRSAPESARVPSTGTFRARKYLLEAMLAEHVTTWRPPPTGGRPAPRPGTRCSGSCSK